MCIMPLGGPSRNDSFDKVGHMCRSLGVNCILRIELAHQPILLSRISSKENESVKQIYISDGPKVNGLKSGIQK